MESHYRSVPCLPSDSLAEVTICLREKEKGLRIVRKPTVRATISLSSIAREPHYSARFFRGCDLLKQDRIPRMDWTAFRSHLGSWARCFFCGRHCLYSRREPFFRSFDRVCTTRRVCIMIHWINQSKVMI